MTLLSKIERIDREVDVDGLLLEQRNDVVGVADVVSFLGYSTHNFVSTFLVLLYVESAESLIANRCTYDGLSDVTTPVAVFESWVEVPKK